ncbi:unnamed protein product [Mucor hiemalis]
MFIHHVLLALSLLMSFSLAVTATDKPKWHMWNQIMAPLLYLGDTPYQNQAFNSANISTAYRIQRDIAMNVTIDQLIWPAIDMSTSFFGKDYSTQRVSELDQPLLMGYKRLVVDIYWDADRLQWQLCPVTITNTTSKSDLLINGYTCAPSFLFGDFMSAINDYLISTEVERAPQQTSLINLILNLHDLPSNNTKVTETRLGEIINHSISKSSSSSLISRIYTPSNLTVDRVNISASFYAHGLEPYFPLYQQNLGSSSPWPQWLYLIEKKVQLLVGFGEIIQGNISKFSISPADQSIIFDPISLGGIGGGMNLSIEEKIASPPQCSLEPLSWSFVNDNKTAFNYDSALKTTQCGYSPYFTHSNYSSEHSKSTDVDSGHLADNVLSTIWSWDVNEPNSDDGRRCAAIKGDNGRWVAHDCAEPLRVACRLATNPNQWVLTKNSFIYDRALSACPQNYIFDIPRIPRQNINLRQVMIAQNLTESKVWINLNLLYNDDSCWVIGRYGTCWWSNDSGQAYLGLIKTSIVAGVIVLLLVGIFTWVKCARIWRDRNSKSRKAMVKNMLSRREYVTVPA